MVHRLGPYGVNGIDSVISQTGCPGPALTRNSWNHAQPPPTEMAMSWLTFSVLSTIHRSYANGNAHDRRPNFSLSQRPGMHIRNLTEIAARTSPPIRPRARSADHGFCSWNIDTQIAVVHDYNTPGSGSDYVGYARSNLRPRSPGFVTLPAIHSFSSGRWRRACRDTQQTSSRVFSELDWSRSPRLAAATALHHPNAWS